MTTYCHLACIEQSVYDQFSSYEKGEFEMS